METVITNPKEIVKEHNQTFANAFREGNSKRLSELYTKDATVLPPASQQVTGNVDIATFWQAIMNFGFNDVKLESVKIESFTDSILEIGKFTLFSEPTGKEKSTEEGKYVVLWKNENGDWKIHIDMWNSFS